MKHNKQLVKKDEGQTPSLWDPFQAEQDLDATLLGHWIGLPFFGHHHHHHVHVPDVSGGQSFIPAVTVAEDDKEFVLSADLPGLEKKELKVEINDGILTMRGEHCEKTRGKDKGSPGQERYFGFQRSFVVPEGVKTGGVKASYKGGTLKVVLPRAKEMKKTTLEIDIT